MAPRLIALCGFAGAGKSTVARELVAHGYTLVKFAAPLKDMMRALGLTEDEIEGDLKERPCALLEGKTPREGMLTLGTEWGRDMISPTLWANAWQRRARAILEAGGAVVTDDCRFLDELAMVHGMGGVAVRLERPGVALRYQHGSETWLADVELPVVANDALPAEVAVRVLAMASHQQEVAHADH